MPTEDTVVLLPPLTPEDGPISPTEFQERWQNILAWNEFAANDDDPETVPLTDLETVRRKAELFHYHEATVQGDWMLVTLAKEWAAYVLALAENGQVVTPPLPFYEPIVSEEAMQDTGRVIEIDGLRIKDMHGPMGGVRLATRDEQVERCINDASGMADEFGGSARIYQMIGEARKKVQFYVLPTRDMGKGIEVADLTVPFNDAEHDLWLENFNYGRGASILARGWVKLYSSQYCRTPREADQQPIIGYVVPRTHARRINQLYKLLADTIETGRGFRHDYKGMTSKAFKIDMGVEPPVPGYEKPAIPAAKKDSYEDWRRGVGEKPYREDGRNNPNYPTFTALD